MDLSREVSVPRWVEVNGTHTFSGEDIMATFECAKCGEVAYLSYATPPSKDNGALSD